MTQRRPRALGAAVTGLTAAVLGLSACGEPEAGATLADVQAEGFGDQGPADQPFDGPYDEDFAVTGDSVEDETVTVEARVEEVVAPTAFTVVRTDEPAGPPVLVVGADEVAGLAPGQVVEVTGTVREAFDLELAEAQLETDLDDTLLAAWGDQPWLAAVDVTPAAED